MVRSARVQEGEQPAEDSAELLKETERLFERLLDLVSAINRTNAKTPFGKTGSISDAIARRDITAKKRDFLSGIADAASTRQNRYSKSEVKFVATISAAQLHVETIPSEVRFSRKYHDSDSRLGL
jgi:hypothetical protein